MPRTYILEHVPAAAASVLQHYELWPPHFIDVTRSLPTAVAFAEGVGDQEHAYLVCLRHARPPRLDRLRHRRPSYPVASRSSLSTGCQAASPSRCVPRVPVPGTPRYGGPRRCELGLLAGKDRPYASSCREGPTKAPRRETLGRSAARVLVLDPLFQRGRVREKAA